MANPLPEPLAAALGVAAGRWADAPYPWLVGGSCGLAFHGVRTGRPPRDLDIYVDAEGAPGMHRALAEYALDEQQFNETERYRSILSHYEIGGVTLELVAGFEVREAGALYRIDIAGQLRPYALAAASGMAQIGVMPLAHELAFNLLRGRPDRFECIAASMRRDLAAHLPALRRIVAGNTFGRVWRSKMAELLGLPADVFDEDGEENVCRE